MLKQGYLSMLLNIIILLVGRMINLQPANCNENSVSAALDDLFAEFYEWRIRVWPEYGTEWGIYTYNTRIDNYTETDFTQQLENATAFLEKVQAIDANSVSQQQWLSKAILQSALETFIDGYQYRVHSLYNSIAHFYHPIYQWARMVSYMPKVTQQDFQNILARYRAIDEQFKPSREQISGLHSRPEMHPDISTVIERITLLEIAMNEGITSHRYELERAISAMETEIDGNVTDSVFYAPFKTEALPDILTEAAKAQLQTDCMRVITDKLRPAIVQFKIFLETDYMPHTPPEVGVGSLPDGQNLYKACLRFHLGSDISPRQVHQLGLTEVKRISALMQDLIAEAGFEGSVREYIAYLRSQPAQYYNTSEEVLDGYREIIEAMHSQLPKVLLHVPDVPIQMAVGFSNRYQGPRSPGMPGTFVANVADPMEVPKFGMVALVLHETSPGHHIQNVYNLESEKLPAFRRNLEKLRQNGVPFNWPFYTASSEGWALYAEYLGEEMGSYSDPTTRFGRYTSEIFRAARLVVDTGMHAFGWSFEEAMEYMQNNTARSDVFITSELKRYIGWPGQACAYKFGELKITQMRHHAETVLGERFDIRVFNDRILSFGKAPLALLEEEIDAWIALQASSAHVLPIMSYAVICASLASLIMCEMSCM